MKRYKFRPGSRLPQAKAEEAGKAIEAIQGEHENVTAEDVLDAARHKTNPLHSLFTWDDTEAARQFRLDEARHILRSLIIEIVQEDGEVIGSGHAYVRLDLVDGEQDGGYIPIEAAMSDVERRERLIDTALREAEAWRSRHASLVELAAVFDALRATNERLRRRKAGRRRSAAMAATAR